MRLLLIWCTCPHPSHLAQVVIARQKEELAQMHARQAELQAAAVEREAAAQDLWVRLEAQRGDLAREAEHGDRSAAELAAALAQLEVLSAPC